MRPDEKDKDGEVMVEDLDEVGKKLRRMVDALLIWSCHDCPEEGSLDV